jgi:Asp-tRNA(Asn)/Glu-tRNA(Gln) amidotransferase B subunit
MKTAESLEVSIEETEKELKEIEGFICLVNEAKISPEIKRDFLNRLNIEQEWLETLIEDDKSAIDFLDAQTDAYIEEMLEKKDGIL